MGPTFERPAASHLAFKAAGSSAELTVWNSTPDGAARAHPTPGAGAVALGIGGGALILSDPSCGGVPRAAIAKGVGAGRLRTGTARWPERGRTATMTFLQGFASSFWIFSFLYSTALSMAVLPLLSRAVRSAVEPHLFLS